MENGEEHLRRRVKLTDSMIKLSNEIKTLEKDVNEKKEQLKQHEESTRAARKRFKIISIIISVILSTLITPFLYHGDIIAFFTSFNFIAPSTVLALGALAPILYDEFNYEMNRDPADISKRISFSIRFGEMKIKEKKLELNELIEKEIANKKSIEAQKNALLKYKKSILGENYNPHGNARIIRTAVPVIDEDNENLTKRVDSSRSKRR